MECIGSNPDAEKKREEWHKRSDEERSQDPKKEIECLKAALTKSVATEEKKA